MAETEDTTYRSRSRLDLSLPDTPYDYGMLEARLAVMANLDLGAVTLSCPEADIELVLGLGNAVDLAMKLVGAIARVMSAGDGE